MSDKLESLNKSLEKLRKVAEDTYTKAKETADEILEHDGVKETMKTSKETMEKAAQTASQAIEYASDKIKETTEAISEDDRFKETVKSSKKTIKTGAKATANAVQSSARALQETTDKLTGTEHLNLLNKRLLEQEEFNKTVATRLMDVLERLEKLEIRVNSFKSKEDS